MPRTPEQNQTIKDKRRAKLISYGIKAFAVNGYDHTAIDDITKPAKCSHGLFYHYFDSKETVFRALIDEQLTQEYELPVKAALELGGVKGLRLLADYAEKVAKATPREVCIAQITVSLADAANLDDYGREFQRSHDLESALVTLLKQGQDEGKVVAGDPVHIARAIMDMVRGGLSRINIRPSEEAAIPSDILFGLILKGPIEE